ncbi:MAG: LamG domain-containing protein [Polyangia bacterium]
MKVLSFLPARLDVYGVFLIAAMAAGCSFDASQLRPLADGSAEHSAQSDAIASAIDGATASSPDAAPGTGGSGGFAGTGGGGGVGVDASRTATDGMAEAGGRTSSGDAAIPPDLASARDVPTPFEAIPPPDAAMDAPLAIDATSTPDAISVSTLGLVLYYSCDQISGTTVPDMSGNGNNGTLLGPVSLVPGKVGNALALTATNNTDAGVSGGYIAMPPAILATAHDMTIAAWFKISSTPSYQRIFEIGNSSTTSSMYLTPTYSDGYPRFTIRTALTDAGLYREDIPATGTTIPTGVWEHVAVVLDASGGRLYLNGVQVGTNTTMKMRPTDLGATPNDWIGASEFSNTPFLDGAIDEFRIYNRALSAAEIVALFNTSTTSPTPGDGGVAGGASDTGGSPTLCSPVPRSTGGIVCPGGKCTVGAYSGSSLTYTDGTSTICMSANSLCATGKTNTLNSTDTITNWGVVFGFDLSPNSTSTNLVGVQLAGSGISVKLSSLPTGAQARVQVTVGATTYYCATMSAASQTLPWTSFNTACWNNTGTYLTGAPTAATQILITVNSETGIAGSFDLCVTSLSFPGSETCPTGYHDDGTGACAPNSVCAAGYHIDGTGACVV